MCAKSSTHLMKLAEEWETHRLPLVRELEAHAANQVHRIVVERAHALESETAYFRAEAKALGMESTGTWKGRDVAVGDTLIQKQEQRQILERKYDAMAKGIHRSMYTARIMDIIKQVHKQKADIQKVLR
ncbi:hypothetical protein DYB32_008058 [Aphanomyces invadans]|uniref:CCDC22 coiled-coil domain-containing protein n=1 Tax=Aphanomyces invadans TaxID=157072 RepID=A0A3R6Z1K0_9STRA|nr:hypothetical protein DYB32_009477 [Aphanomyces invadans]RHY27552.1 hypothetical protein DYB32_008058 [Aphanomyces invadans]